ncbi:MAG: AAA family ATPase [Synergistaceae bacterium]|nr:AAA family ATPase [Synergistaceae bacterium]MBR2207591.1 AAA family ATPase [Synergistaceae bacterium]
MFQDISILELQGANFIKETLLPIFQSSNDNKIKAVNVSIIYGRNGSGKSVIARAFNKLKGKDEPMIQKANLNDIKGNKITLSEQEKLHTFVFNEDFVNANVRVVSDGLSSIVMLGEQIELAERINIAKIELQEAKDDQERKKIVVEKYNDSSNEISPMHYIEKMKSILREDEGWAGRKRKIESQTRKTNAPVSDNTYKRFITLTPTKSRDELIIDFDTKYRELQRAQSGTSKISEKIPDIDEIYFHFNVQTANKLLQQDVEIPELNEREQYLLELVQNGYGNELQRTALEFADSQIIKCPKCQQPLTVKYKTDLITSIKKVLSDKVEKYKQNLKSQEIPEIELNLSYFQNLQSCQSCVDCIISINQIIRKNNELLQSKSDNPYLPITDKLINFSKEVAELKTFLVQLEKERLEHNHFVTDTIPIIKELNSINDDIAYYDIVEDARKFNAKSVEQKIVNDDYNTAVIIAEGKQKYFNELIAQRSNIDIAVDIINDGLKYIFLSKKRLQLKIEGNVYKLLCNGHFVKPNNISVGERNIIGLCYFFASILHGKNTLSAYDEEYLLVIDDPVSSHDFENKIGIFSYLQYQCEKFLFGNIKTRILVMTHDLMTAFNINRIYEDICKKCKEQLNVKLPYALMELIDTNIKPFPKSISEYNEYTEMLKLIYAYGKGEATEHEIYIGNIMRQAMEAFSTFEFKQGIKILTDDKILSVIESKEIRNYFKNIMYHLVLHGGSHRREQTQNMDMNFFSFISETEKRQTAKDILCFMYLLNLTHIKAHLGEERCKDIQLWCEQIKIEN